jgi:hypothetical protein
MGVIFFAMPGIVLVTAIWKYINAKLPRVSVVKVSEIAAISTDTGITATPLRPKTALTTPAETSRLTTGIRTGLRYAAYAALLLAFVFGTKIP